MEEEANYIPLGTGDTLQTETKKRYLHALTD